MLLRHVAIMDLMSFSWDASKSAIFLVAAVWGISPSFGQSSGESIEMQYTEVY